MTPLEIAPYTYLGNLFRRAIEGALPTSGPQPATFADGVECVKVIEAIPRPRRRPAEAWFEPAAG